MKNTTLLKPILQKEFVFVMEFLGSKRGPSPLLRSIDFNILGLDPIDILDDLLASRDNSSASVSLNSRRSLFVNS